MLHTPTRSGNLTQFCSTQPTFTSRLRFPPNQFHRSPCLPCSTHPISPHHPFVLVGLRLSLVVFPCSLAVVALVVSLKPDMQVSLRGHICASATTATPHPPHNLPRAYMHVQLFFALMVVSKGFSYALNSPAREMLYAVTSEQIKFKAKSWIDVFGGASFTNQLALEFSKAVRQRQPVFVVSVKLHFHFFGSPFSSLASFDGRVIISPSCTKLRVCFLLWAGHSAKAAGSAVNHSLKHSLDALMRCQPHAMPSDHDPILFANQPPHPPPSPHPHSISTP